MNPILNILKTEWNNLRERKKIFVFYITLFFIAGSINLINPYLIGVIFNSIQKSITTTQQLYHLIFMISLLLVLTIIFWAIHGFARVTEQNTGYFVKRNYLDTKIKEVLDLPVKWHKDNHSGDTIDKINRASSALEEFSMHRTFDIIYGITSFIGSIIILCVIDWKIGLFSLVYASSILIIISKIDKRLIKKYRELNKYGNKASATIYDYLGNIITVITLRLKKSASEKINERQMAGHSIFKESVVMNETKWGFASVALSAMIVGILIYKSYIDFYTSGIMIGTLYMLYGYLNNVGNTFFKFASLYGNLIRTNTNIENAKSIENEYNKLKDFNCIILPKDWKEIDLKDVSFSYDKQGKRIHINKINFKFKKGEKIALVGESGSGKSTILSLIRGLYDIEDGKVYCDKKELCDGIISIRKYVTLIPQDPELFNSTLRYNITMGKNYSQETLEKVIEIAQLRKVIDRLDLGLETNIMEKGVNLSGGEKQRLALARGILAGIKSDIVLLDEPTSSVDSLNEIRIHEQLFKEFSDKTIISSIHRLHLLDRFDYIYLFSQGKIIGQGTFNDLKKNPIFNKMWEKYNSEKIHDERIKKSLV